MHETNFIVREPLLDPKQRVIGYELCWQRRNDRDVADADLESLVAFVAEHLVDEEISIGQHRCELPGLHPQQAVHRGK